MCTLSSYTTEGVVWTVPAENVILPQISEWISSETNEECRCVIVRVEGKMKIWERNERGRGGGEMRGNEDEKGRFAHFNELTAGVRTTGLELQPSVCVCVCVWSLHLWWCSSCLSVITRPLRLHRRSTTRQKNCNYSHLESSYCVCPHPSQFSFSPKLNHHVNLNQKRN